MSTSFHLALKNLQHFLIILKVSVFVIFQIHKLQKYMYHATTSLDLKIEETIDVENILFSLIQVKNA